MVFAEAPTSFVIGPAVVTSTTGRIVVVLLAYVVTLALSGHVVRFFVLPRNLPPLPKRTREQSRFDPSMLIGKCENLLAVTFILLGQATGLALIFTGKSLVRADDIKRDPGFFLGGTLINLVWAVIVGSIARYLVAGL